MPRKQRRRGHNEGSIYQLADGRWAAAMSLPRGKRKYFYGKTREEVSRKLKQAQYQQEQGLLITAKAQKLGPFLNEWLETVKKPEIKYRSYVSYRKNLDLYLLPALSKIDVQKLTALDVQRLYNDLGTKLGASSIRGVHAVLREALDYAVKTEQVARNVCDVVSLPRMKKRDYQTITAEGIQQLVEAVKGHWIEPMILLAATTGLRRGELLGLHWDDVDLRQGRITVRRSAGWQKGKGTVASTTKTEQERTILLIPQVVQALKEHRVKQTLVSKIVFCNEQGDYRSGEWFYRVFQDALERAGLPKMRLHDLRHSVATILIGLGIDAAIVQAILGHASISTTVNVYGHVKPEMQQEAMKKLGELFG